MTRILVVRLNRTRSSAISCSTGLLYHCHNDSQNCASLLLGSNTVLGFAHHVDPTTIGALNIQLEGTIIVHFYNIIRTITHYTQQRTWRRVIYRCHFRNFERQSLGQWRIIIFNLSRERSHMTKYFILRGFRRH